MMHRLPSRLFLIAVAAASLGGCHRKPGGQVVATVDGDEITRRDLLAELQAAGGRSEADLNAAQGALTSALIDRKLLVEEAKREKLDRNPAFLALEQRQHDVLLASMLAQTLTHIQKPSESAVQQFIAENPQIFGSRKLLLVSQVNAPAKGITQQEIAPLHSQQAIVALLNTKKIKFVQRNVVLDTATLPKTLVDKLLSTPSGEPLAVSGGPTLSFTTVLQQRDAPVPPAQRDAVAQSAMAQQSARKQLGDQVKQLRAAADIRYLPGFEPTNGPHASGETSAL